MTINKSPDFVKERLVRIFRRHGSNGQFARVFDELAEGQRDTLLSAVQLHSDESPVLGGVESSERWFVITTQRATWFCGKQLRTIAARDIRDAVVDLDAFGLEKTKREMNEVQIVAKSGERLPFPVEAGTPLSGVWNTLKGLARISQGMEAASRGKTGLRASLSR